MPRNNDKNLLHPALREKLGDLETHLMVSHLPIYLYEGARSPFRQAELYAIGRYTGEKGKTVTKAEAWESYHQYGLAADYVFRDGGKWTWPPKSDKRWGEFHHIARSVGLKTLSLEYPHVQLDWPLDELRQGKFPSGSPGPWLDWIETNAEAWGSTPRLFSGHMHPGAPPVVDERPPLEGVA